MKSEDIPKGGLDPQRGRVVADELRELGVRGILITAAERGYITELACGMPQCFCPEELGGTTYFEPRGSGDWEPTHEHYPRAKREGGRRDLDNSVLAHRLCNRIDYSILVGRSHSRDLQRIENARAEAIRNAQNPRFVRYERFNTEHVYLVEPASTDALSLHSPEDAEPQS